MGNFFFGPQKKWTEATVVPATQVPNWCFLTSQFAMESAGEAWTADMCEKAMQKDTKDILENIETYIVDLSPQDQAMLQEAVVLNNFDNKSAIDAREGTLGDDPRWTLELTKRVKDNLKAEGRIVASDKKIIINGAIRRKSKLSRRTLYTLGEPEFGELGTVFNFSGRA